MAQGLTKIPPASSKIASETRNCAFERMGGLLICQPLLILAARTREPSNHEASFGLVKTTREISSRDFAIGPASFLCARKILAN
jgi:hypothetical protein